MSYFKEVDLALKLNGGEAPDPVTVDGLVDKGVSKDIAEKVVSNQPEVVEEEAKPMSASAKAQYRYAGRAIAALKAGKFERQPVDGHVYKYRSPNGGGTYTVDVSEDLGICNCAEYRVNLHAMSAVARGVRVGRNPGPVCYHILACRVLASTPGSDDAFDLHGIIEKWDAPAKAEAKQAYFSKYRQLIGG